MAKRTRKQKQRAVTRRPVAGVAPAAPAPADTYADLDTLASPAAAAATEVGPRRRVERVSPAAAPALGVSAGTLARRPQRGQSSGFIEPLESDDAAIPFDRVPYVPADLRRVAIIAAVMIALIIVADIIVSNVVK
jgi:hypothetical protein